MMVIRSSMGMFKYTFVMSNDTNCKLRSKGILI